MLFMSVEFDTTYQTSLIHTDIFVEAIPKSLNSRTIIISLSAMAKTSVRPANAPSTTGRPSGTGRGNNAPSKPSSPKKSGK